MHHAPLLARPILRLVPFYYGWVVLGCVCAAAVARAGPAVATLSIFVEPMTREFGWSRAEMAGAVSLGGILAALTSPMIGTFLDRRGPRVVLAIAVLVTGATILLLSRIESLLAFYVLFCIARMNFAGPFDLGIHGAVSNWFIERRPLAGSIVQLSQMFGLLMMPLVGHLAMQQADWRSGWLAIGMMVLVIGFLPGWLLLVRRPEDVGLAPDGSAHLRSGDANAAKLATKPESEPAFTRTEALRTRAFWMLGCYTLLVYPVQAGVSLHQAAHLIERGLSATAAVTAVSAFSVASAGAGLLYGLTLRRIGVRNALAFAGLLLAGSAIAMLEVSTNLQAIAAAILFGRGIGGLHIVLPVAWADYFGRRNFGAIRGIALSIQVTAQASGPLLSGLLRDATGTYRSSLLLFACLGIAAMVPAWLVKPPPAGSQSPAV